MRLFYSSINYISINYDLNKDEMKKIVSHTTASKRIKIL